ncbi:hypothetical protein CGRA01v4_10494 [Colletotrichum graminicola]|nr:hypothetical protein CGRA01v4_10494 [Colletotrichum graminicola]
MFQEELWSGKRPDSRYLLGAESIPAHNIISYPVPAPGDTDLLGSSSKPKSPLARFYPHGILVSLRPFHSHSPTKSCMFSLQGRRILLAEGHVPARFLLHPTHHWYQHATTTPNSSRCLLRSSSLLRLVAAASSSSRKPSLTPN